MAKMIQKVDIKVKRYPTRREILDYLGCFEDWQYPKFSVHQHPNIKQSANSLYSASDGHVAWHDDVGVEFNQDTQFQRTIATFYTEGYDVTLMVKRGAVVAKMNLGDGDTIIFDHRLKRCVVNTKPGSCWGAIVTPVILKDLTIF